MAIILLTVFSLAIATRIWTPEELKSHLLMYQPAWSCRPETIIPGPRRFNYLHRIKMLCEFLVHYQVADSLSPDFGGIIEAEHLPSIIETDNTQEALWVWTRWYELTGRDNFRENISRAWHYILNHPAYQEHQGNPANIWYAVWNCGLGMWAEACYRRVYQDSSYLFYADSCRNFYFVNPLNPENYLDNFVTAQASGMAYDYAQERNDPILKDTALARGIRVKNWIEQCAGTRLSFQTWAMCGATAFWGIARTYCQEETVAGKRWLETYTDSLPGFYPSGTWNCSHNIWLANAYRAAGEINHNPNHFIYHQHLTDTLLMKDTDLDGGIPATWTDLNTQDQTWISTYLDFMGIDRLVSPVYDQDLSLFEFIQPEPHQLFITGDTLKAALPVANVGRNTSLNTEINLFLSGIIIDSISINPIPFLDTDTVRFSPFNLSNPGEFELLALLNPDQNPSNDTIRHRFKVYRNCQVNACLLDSLNRNPVSAVIKTQLFGRTALWDSTTTDTVGNFTLNLIDSTFAITIEPEPPYYRRKWTIAITGDTAITFLTTPAQVMVVNNDTLGNYSHFYTSTLDTLGINWCLWQRRSAGPLHYYLLDRLQSRTVIWFSGNSIQQTIPPADQETLNQFLASGGNLILTGQNIAEELVGTQFLESLIGCRFDSSDWRGFLVFGNRGDSLGRQVTGISTAGGNGANNQNSRDIISPVSNSDLFLVYDTITNLGCGTRRQIPNAGKVIMLGFGFEAVNRPASRPNYFSRVQLMNIMLNWLFTGIGVAESPPLYYPTGNFGIQPAVFTDRLVVESDRPVQIFLFDIMGRQVACIQTISNTTIWNTSLLPAGVYFARSDRFRCRSLVKIR